MSDFDDVAGEAGLNPEDALEISAVEEEEDDAIDPLDEVVPDDEDGGEMGGEEDSDEAEVAAYMYQDYDER